ncbi:hypothetical protein [Mycobacterium sp. NAZ190054]|uniref:hypothetical protein n=1 Tax=Mycobacterium sp. NAZ190054 TaxID=1747766 RepID=UPI000799F7B5|nr:hypothetical protein [Mycobacterium sp. NAZ190054]KWX65974.1 hypothetical protein ASJ79_27130 [Mycobacterium sp. NAZ190054]
MTAGYGTWTWQPKEASFWAAATLGVPILLSAALLRTLVVEMVLGHFGFSESSARGIAVVTTLTILGLCFFLLRLAALSWMRGTALAAAVAGVFVLTAAMLML